MKKPRPHPQKALTSVKVNGLSKPGRYADGNGLYLVVDPSGAKRWVLRTMVRGKRRDIGLGGVRLVSLAEARSKAHEYRKLAREGGDPLEAKRQASVSVPTFAEAADRTLDQYRGGWKNEKHASAWLNTLKTYVYPVMGDIHQDAEICIVLSDSARKERAFTGKNFTTASSGPRQVATECCDDLENERVAQLLMAAPDAVQLCSLWPTVADQ